jgi:glyoxylase-like metal-dependent hydrolase (beta-lactamase superfamily II)
MGGLDAICALIDLKHMGRPQSVATYLLETRTGPVIVDPGPASTIPALRAGLAEQGYEVEDLAALLLTHIHLDHAGGSGTLARENPGLLVYVHRVGAPHVADPSKLLRSATQLYGDKMEQLWGDVAPVPPEQIQMLSGGEVLALGGREFEVAYTPGHAAHHVSYFERGTGIAFVGDTAGLRGPPHFSVLPVTPPPDFNLEAWLDSLRTIAAWRPDRLALTHFGVSPDPERHLEDLRAGLVAWAERAQDSLAIPGNDADRLKWFGVQLEGWLDGRVPADQARKFLGGAGVEACWQGLARYWRKMGVP